eukprot:341251-Rhodomonas_salina.1
MFVWIYGVSRLGYLARSRMVPGWPRSWRRRCASTPGPASLPAPAPHQTHRGRKKCTERVEKECVCGERESESESERERVRARSDEASTHTHTTLQ